MEGWEELILTRAKRPLLLDGEHELIIQQGVGIYQFNLKTEYSEGCIITTTHRLLYISEVPSPLRALQLSLQLITELDTSVVKVWSLAESPKIGIKCSNGAYFRLSFRKGGRDKVLLSLRKALRTKAWDSKIKEPSLPLSKPTNSPNTPSPETKREEFSTRHAGVGGIVRKKTEASKTTDAQLKEAFKDIDALMEKAKEMVDLSKNLSKMSSDQNADLREFMISMGIDNPVTKQSAGALYHTELAKQVSDFMQGVLPQYPGEIMPLAQVYCLYNRARGTDLISPEDLYRACVLMEPLGLPVQLREFSSGVRALEPRNHSDRQFSIRIEQLIEERGPVTVAGLAETFSISVTLAKEQLLLAEQQGLLCRDDSIQGLLFFKNFFLEYPNESIN